MRSLFVALFTSLFFFSCSAQNSNKNENGNENSYEVLTSQQYEQEIAKEGAVIIDVRTAEEYQEGHIPGAKNINFYAPDFKDQIAQLNKEKVIYIYCRSGDRSGKAGKMMQEMGFKNIHDLQGGFMSWGGAVSK